MKLQWILLALFLIAMVRNVAKAMRNPMLKNFLRLISILVAFIITFILQICGVFQNIAAKAIEGTKIAEMVPGFENAMGNSINLILPFCTTLISPLLFVLTFAIILFVLKIIHVNIIYKFIVRRKRRKEIKEFKLALKEEKMLLKRAITENEARFINIMESIAIANPGLDTYNYDSLDEDEIDRMVEQRIKLEKKKKKKVGFFKESSERKAMSLVCGVVCGFLLFGITWMGLFYTMDFLSDVTDVVYETESQDSKIYQIVEMVDEHVVAPYEESFVYQLYDSMAIVDLMTFTVEAGGQVQMNDKMVFAGQLMREYTQSAIRLACEMTTNNPNAENIANDIKVLAGENSVVVMIMADFIVDFADNFEEGDLDTSNPFNAILASVIKNYQGEDSRETVVNDLASMTDLVVIAANNKLLSKIISDNTDMLVLLEDQTMMKDFAKAMSHLSFYPSAMQSAFTLGIDAFGTTLMPQNNAAGYETFVGSIVSAASDLKSMTPEDITAIQTFFKEAAAYKINDGKLAYIQGKIDALADDEQNKLTELVNQYNDLLAAQTTDANVLDYILDPLYTLELIIADFGSLNSQLTLLQEMLLNAQTPEDYLAITEEIEELHEVLDNLRNAATAQFDAFKARIGALAPFVNYFMNWTNVQKPFMLANEDGSTACLAMNIDGTIYACTTDFLDISTLLDFVLKDDIFEDLGNSDVEDGLDDSTEEGAGDLSRDGNGTENGDISGIISDDIFNVDINKFIDQIPMQELLTKLSITSDTDAMVEEGRVSELTDLVNFIIFSANGVEEINDEWFYLLLKEDYLKNSDNTESASYQVANKIAQAHGNHGSFDYKGVTVEKMKLAMNFSENKEIWTLEQRENDSEKLVAIIYSLLDIVDAMGGNAEINPENPEATNNSDTKSLLGLIVTLGKAMDQMDDTTCLNGVPAIMIEGILKNDLLSIVMTPSMLYGEHGYLSRLESGAITYADLMAEISEMASDVLDRINGTKEEVVQ